MRRLRRHAVQLDDRQIVTRHERLAIPVADVEAAEMEASHGTRDLVDARLERRRQQRAAVAELGALRVVAGLGQPEALAVVQDPAGVARVPREEHAGLQPIARMRAHQRVERRMPVADDPGESLVGDREHAATSVAGMADVEDAGLEWALVRDLQQNGARFPCEAGFRIGLGADPRDAAATLADVRLQDERVGAAEGDDAGA